MKPLPDLQDNEAMAARGRRSSLMSARKEALEALRDEYTKLTNCDVGEMWAYAGSIIEHAQQLQEISRL